MKRSFSQNLSANTAQLLINQVLSLLVFILLAKTLSKGDFGVLNLSLAILLTAFGILSFGIDQLLVRKVASGESVKEHLSIALFHNLLVGVIFYALLFLLYLLPLHLSIATLLLLGVGKFALSLSMPYKQVMVGAERFKTLLYMSIGSNISRVIGLVVLNSTGHLNLQNAVLVFLSSDVTEFVVSTILFHTTMKTSISFPGLRKRYASLLREALPQLGTVTLAAAMARFDWIFIGLFLTTSKLAEYSFAYKVFELCQFPLLVIAPLLVPKMTKAFREPAASTQDLSTLYRMEMLIASFVFLTLNLCWEPLANLLSSGKYGSVNNLTVFILSLSMPVLYFNNFLWSVHFSRGRTKLIFKIFAITFAINAVANCLLVPFFGNEGAAAAYLVAIVIQTVLYYRKAGTALSINWFPLLLCTLSALAGIGVARLIPNTALSAATGILAYLFLLVVTKQLYFQDKRYFRLIFRY